MDITPYNIIFWDKNFLTGAEVKPCCREDNVVDYSIYIHGNLVFNITKPPDTSKWIVSLKNADKEIDDEVVQRIGVEIERHNNKQ